MRFPTSYHFTTLLYLASCHVINRINAQTVDLTRPAPNTTYSPIVDPSFVGFSIEWTHVDDGLGPGVGANMGTDYQSSPIVLNLFAHLSEAARGYPPTVRIGGNSGTRLWWQGSVLPRLNQSVWSVNDVELKIIEEFASQSGCKFVLTVPMLSPNPAYAVEFLTRGVIQNIAPDHILAIEIGNEPDHYEKNDRRPPNYVFDMFLSEYSTALTAIREAIGPDFQYQGPAFAYPWNDAHLIPFMQNQTQTKYISFHKYGQRGCSTATNPDAVTPLTLLMDPNPEEYDWLDTVAQVAKQNNQSVVWGEGGSASCNGTAGVSDVFVSALWTVDMLLEMAYREVRYASISGAAQTYYAPFMYDDATGHISARPTYYAMLMVSRILRGTGSSVFRAPINEGWALTGNALKTWGINNTESGEVTLVAIHKDPALISATLTVQYPNYIPSTPGCLSGKLKGYITRLEAPSINSTSGIRLNGQTWDDSPDGHPIGNYTEEIIEPDEQSNTFTLVVSQYTVIALRIGCQPGLASRVYTPPPPQPFTPPGFTPDGTNGTATPTLSPAPVSAQAGLKNVGRLVAIGVSAGILGLGSALCLITFLRRRRTKTLGVPPLGDGGQGQHPHPYARESPYLFGYGGRAL